MHDSNFSMGMCGYLKGLRFWFLVELRWQLEFYWLICWWINSFPNMKKRKKDGVVIPSWENSIKIQLGWILFMCFFYLISIFLINQIPTCNCTSLNVSIVWLSYYECCEPHFWKIPYPPLTCSPCFSILDMKSHNIVHIVYIRSLL
jgi:hypothetical protein